MRAWVALTDLVRRGENDGGFDFEEPFRMPDIRDHIRHHRQVHGKERPVLPLEPWLLDMAFESIELGFEDYEVAKIEIKEE